MRPEPVEGRSDGPARLANLPSGTSPMAPNDAFFAYLDSREVRQELGVVIELGSRPDGTVAALSEMRAEIIRGFRDLLAMRRGLVQTTRPAWRPYPEASLDRQVRDLVPQPPIPGQEPEHRLLSTVTAFWSEPLPDHGPAWCAGHVQDPETGRSLVAIKLHRSVADGLAALPILDRAFGANTAAGFASSALAIAKPREPFATRLRSWALVGLRSRQPRRPRAGPSSAAHRRPRQPAPRGGYLGCATR
jgi:Wax ester synthase-like Acyl-CoA acyltransferase domain